MSGVRCRLAVSSSSSGSSQTSLACRNTVRSPATSTNAACIPGRILRTIPVWMSPTASGSPELPANLSTDTSTSCRPRSGGQDSPYPSCTGFPAHGLPRPPRSAATVGQPLAVPLYQKILPDDSQPPGSSPRSASTSSPAAPTSPAEADREHHNPPLPRARSPPAGIHLDDRRPPAAARSTPAGRRASPRRDVRAAALPSPPRNCDPVDRQVDRLLHEGSLACTRRLQEPQPLRRRGAHGSNETLPCRSARASGSPRTPTGRHPTEAPVRTRSSASGGTPGCRRSEHPRG